MKRAGIRECGLMGSSGFSLIEIALVLVLIGILVSMGADLIPMLVKHNKLGESRAAVKEAKTAVIGYALATGKLPYAASGTDGRESANVYRGYLPYAELGISGSDAYATKLFYTVDPYLTDSHPQTVDKLKAKLDRLISTSSSIGPCYDDEGSTIHVSFMVISAGADMRVNSPNDDNNNGILAMAGDNYSLARPGDTDIAGYDDILDAVGFTALRGRLE